MEGKERDVIVRDREVEDSKGTAQTQRQGIWQDRDKVGMGEERNYEGEGEEKGQEDK